MVDAIRFNKIKVDGKTRICLDYDELVGDGKTNEYSMKCVDRARPEFYDLLQALRRHVAQICELPTKPSDIARMEVRGISLSWTNDIMGVVITALKELKRSNSPLVINTPHMPVEPYSDDGDPTKCLDRHCVEGVENLISEARRYLEGDRAQIDIFQEEEAIV